MARTRSVQDDDLAPGSSVSLPDDLLFDDDLANEPINEEAPATPLPAIDLSTLDRTMTYAGHTFEIVPSTPTTFHAVLSYLTMVVERANDAAKIDLKGNYADFVNVSPLKLVMKVVQYLSPREAVKLIALLAYGPGAAAEAARRTLIRDAKPDEHDDHDPYPVMLDALLLWLAQSQSALGLVGKRLGQGTEPMQRSLLLTVDRGGFAPLPTATETTPNT